MTDNIQATGPNPFGSSSNDSDEVDEIDVDEVDDSSLKALTMVRTLQDFIADAQSQIDTLNDIHQQMEIVDEHYNIESFWRTHEKEHPDGVTTETNKQELVMRVHCHTIDEELQILLNKDVLDTTITSEEGEHYFDIEAIYVMDFEFL